MNRLTAGLVLGLSLAFATAVEGYPLDGAERFGLRRLAGYRAAQNDPQAAHLPAGALLSIADIELSLTGTGRDWDLQDEQADPRLQAGLARLLEDEDPSLGVLLIDFSRPSHIRWAAWREDRSQYPGSVNKTLCLLAFFDALARAFPRLEDRERLLRETQVVADSWVETDSHAVPHFDEASSRNRFAPILKGQSFSMAEWLDHMVSPSSNAAGSIVWREAMLLDHFGAGWPVSAAAAERFFDSTPKAELTRLSLAVISGPLLAAGLDPSALRQGTFWTRGGRSIVPGLRSFASPRELAQLFLRLEQGRLVDSWSSLEMKRFLYLTRKRYRYAYPRELREAALYFKSGSFYRCEAEEGHRCGKYAGNVTNLMNSIALIESPATPGPAQKRYIVALMSNVLRKNSAAEHARLAAALEALVLSLP